MCVCRFYELATQRFVYVRRRVLPYISRSCGQRDADSTISASFAAYEATPPAVAAAAAAAFTAKAAQYQCV